MQTETAGLTLPGAERLANDRSVWKFVMRSGLSARAWPLGHQSVSFSHCQDIAKKKQS